MTSTAVATEALVCECRITRPLLLYASITGLALAFLLGLVGVMLLSGAFSQTGETDLGPGLLVLLVALPGLVLMWRLLLRAQPQYQATLAGGVLELVPLGRAARQNASAYRIELSNISGYVRTYQANALFLRLHLAGKQVLRLVAEPRPVRLPAEAPWVGLEAVADQLIAQLHAGQGAGASLERPNFFQGVVGHVLAGFCAVGFLLGIGLLLAPGVDWTQGSRLLVFSSMYLSVYAANRRKTAARP
ncbi:hypothetical protein D3Y59_03295 [Hymenobacter oligotrophus]|uniref:Uncharacterized protein n=1 Tax=Hymenobacter oligotrophus TaxID=2319843 RepID=A0A3B7QXU1_9BACT|nr:hypothetical protein [Hymenobacter oligotrophus]AYA36172.1 hypothetical protein D3Y59_03295 [Hymenobacter oligotrophus]